MRAIGWQHAGPELGPVIAAAFAAGRPRTLAFGAPDRKAHAALADAAAGRGVVEALAWLIHDLMDEAHGRAQDIDTVDGSYVHAIVHRREPDPDNAAYWFRRVGEHPVFPELLADARELVAPVVDAPRPLVQLVSARTWAPTAFVDLCTSRVDGATEAALLAIQRRECALLLDFTIRERARASGGS